MTTMDNHPTQRHGTPFYFGGPVTRSGPQVTMTDYITTAAKSGLTFGLITTMAVVEDTLKSAQGIIVFLGLASTTILMVANLCWDFLRKREQRRRAKAEADLAETEVTFARDREHHNHHERREHHEDREQTTAE